MEKNAKALSLEDFSDCLKEYGLKVTSQRLAVHKAMLSIGHASADMVSSYIKERGENNVTVASVYNILSQLADLGIYQYLLSSNNKMYFDVNGDKHIHLYDTENQGFSDIRDDDLYKMIEDKLLRRRFKGYKIDGINIQVLCHPSQRRKR